MRKKNDRNLPVPLKLPLECSAEIIRLFGSELTRFRVNEFPIRNAESLAENEIGITTEEAQQPKRCSSARAKHLPCHKKLWHSPKTEWRMSSWFFHFHSRKHVVFGVFCITTELICAPIIINFNPSDKWRWSMQIWWMVHFNLHVSFISGSIEISKSFWDGKKGKKKRETDTKYLIWHFVENSLWMGKRKDLVKGSSSVRISKQFSLIAALQVLVKIIFTFASPTCTGAEIFIARDFEIFKVFYDWNLCINFVTRIFTVFNLKFMIFWMRNFRSPWN